MLKNFNQYIKENNDLNNPVASKYASDVINIIKKLNDPGDDYIEIRELEYHEPESFDLVLQLKLNDSPDFKNDSHFNNLQWEELNYKRYGFAIDGNTIIDKSDLIVPEIVLTIIIDPNRIPDVYDELKFRLIDIISHESKHTNQVGWNREPFNVRPSSKSNRDSAKRSFKYFILPDEIEAYVYGMYTRSKIENTYIDKIFNKYLDPFIKTKQITESEYLKVLNAWIKHTLENYPDAEFSPGDRKIEKIINSI